MTGKQFKKLRESTGLSQTQLAREIDMYVRTISRWETGELPVPKVAKLALRFIQQRRKEERKR
ncbi:MAG: helix-turn-helix domain-containing protein [Deltaproteobacteria bacterium]|nr:helix-turn-helix domain-containing protein [Deltaproteobacteria bacterium]